MCAEALAVERVEADGDAVQPGGAQRRACAASRTPLVVSARSRMPAAPRATGRARAGPAAAAARHPSGAHGRRRDRRRRRRSCRSPRTRGACPSAATRSPAPACSTGSAGCSGRSPTRAGFEADARTGSTQDQSSIPSLSLKVCYPRRLGPSASGASFMHRIRVIPVLALTLALAAAPLAQDQSAPRAPSGRGGAAP